MKSALRKLLLLISIVLVTSAASGCGTGSAKSSETPKPNDPVPEVAEAKEGDSAKTNQAVPVKTEEYPKSAQERRQLLEAVGALTAANCYQTYLNIGFIADGKAKGAYIDRDANKVLDSVLSLLNSVERNLAALGKMDLDKQDRESLEQMRDLSALLRVQGKELQAYWDSGKDEDAAKYDNTRKDSWAAIGKLTGIGR
jgi:hypothetical protein